MRNRRMGGITIIENNNNALLQYNARGSRGVIAGESWETNKRG